MLIQWIEVLLKQAHTDTPTSQQLVMTGASICPLHIPSLVLQQHGGSLCSDGQGDDAAGGGSHGCA